MIKQNMEGGVVSSLAAQTTPANEHGSTHEFAITTADLRNPDYDTAPLLAWLGADWIANGYRVISEYRVAIPQITATAPVGQLATSTILESA
jgi:hypothetical protein